MLFQSIWNLFRIYETENWKQTEASVYSIRIKKDEKARDDNFYPVIEYDYKINGVYYSGDRLTLRNTTGHRNEWWAMNEAESHLKKGDSSKVLIYYDPENPGSSTIVRGDKNSEYGLLFYGIFFIILGLSVNKKFIISKIKRLREKS